MIARLILLFACLLFYVGVPVSVLAHRCHIQNCDCEVWGDCTTCTGENCVCRCWSADEPGHVPNRTRAVERFPELSFHPLLSEACELHHDSVKLKPKQSVHIFAETVYPQTVSASLSVYLANPTRDDIFRVWAALWPCTPTDKGCVILAKSSCSYPANQECVYRQPQTRVDSIFNVSACAPYNRADVTLACLETPGLFNGHCELEYAMIFCKGPQLPSYEDNSWACRL